MRNLILAFAAAGALAASVATPAEASGGCGPYGHRNIYGRCAPGGQWGYGVGGTFYGPGYSRYSRYGGYHYRYGYRHYY